VPNNIALAGHQLPPLRSPIGDIEFKIYLAYQQADLAA